MLVYLLGIILRPFSKVQRNGEPLRAVLVSWFFIQVCCAVTHVLFIYNISKRKALAFIIILTYKYKSAWKLAWNCDINALMLPLFCCFWYQILIGPLRETYRPFSNILHLFFPFLCVLMIFFSVFFSFSSPFFISRLFSWLAILITLLCWSVCSFFYLMESPTWPASYSKLHPHQISGITEFTACTYIIILSSSLYLYPAWGKKPVESSVVHVAYIIRRGRKICFSSVTFDLCSGKNETVHMW